MYPNGTVITHNSHSYPIIHSYHTYSMYQSVVGKQRQRMATFLNPKVGAALRNRMINELRPIVWSERPQGGGSLSVSVQLRFASVEKPRIGENGSRMLPCICPLSVLVCQFYLYTW